LVGYETLYQDVDVVTIRENTEGEYSGIEHTVCCTHCSVVIMMLTQCNWLPFPDWNTTAERHVRAITVCF